MSTIDKLEEKEKYPHFGMFYNLERISTFHGDQYRYYSLYNGARGAWGVRRQALEDGEKHAHLIKQLENSK